MDERRRFIRVDVCSEVEYVVLPMKERILKSESRNVSQGGICFLSKEEISKGSFLHLKFHIPDSGRTFIECLGKVVWQDSVDGGYLTGVEFKDLDAAKELKINMFVLNFIREIKEYDGISS